MKVRTPLLPAGFVVPSLVFLIWKTIFTFFIPCITIQLLQLEPTNAHSFINGAILQHTSFYMCRSWIVSNPLTPFCAPWRPVCCVFNQLQQNLAFWPTPRPAWMRSPSCATVTPHRLHFNRESIQNLCLIFFFCNIVRGRRRASFSWNPISNLEVTDKRGFATQTRWSATNTLLEKYSLQKRHFLSCHKYVRGGPLKSFLLTYSMEQSPSWEASRFLASQEIPRILWNRKVYKSPPPVPILSQINPAPHPDDQF